MLLPTPADAAEVIAQTFLVPRYARVAKRIPGSIGIEQSSPLTGLCVNNDKKRNVD